MAVDLKQLELLKGEMPYKWREQSVNARGATMVAYIDARQLFDKLDEVCGVGNWQSDFRLVDGKLYGGIGILVENAGWVWKWDVGSESNVEKEKGESSDALKRAGVQWGVGRFLYGLGIVTLKSADYQGKFKPSDDSGKIIWDREALSDLCMKAIKEGKLDRTKLNSSTTTPNTPNSTTSGKTLPWLNKTDERFNKAVEALKAKTTTVEAIKKSYKLSKEVEAELTKL